MKTKKIVLTVTLIAIVFSAFLLTKPVAAEPDYQNITVKQAHRMSQK